MKCTECAEKLNDLVDGDLDPADASAVTAHLSQCPGCQRALAGLNALRASTAKLPRELTPSRDLWSGIEEDLVPPPVAFRASTTARTQGRPRRGSRRRLAFVALAASVAVLISRREQDEVPAVVEPGWVVTSVEGDPLVESKSFKGEARLRVGGWLETDASSRAKVEAGSIGEVKLEPNSRLRLVAVADTDHRLELAKGTLSALIWAPPRIFFVDTPSATAIDLGCAYTLTVDDAGGGLLSVTSGYVALQAPGGREIIVPAGMSCLTQRGKGPGTPFTVSAALGLRDALKQFDFGSGGDAALSAVLANATRLDAVTLWHLLVTAPAGRRGEVYDALVGLTSVPTGITREGVIAGDDAMHRRWGEALGVYGLVTLKNMKVVPKLAP